MDIAASDARVTGLVMASFVMAIAESRTIDELGALCHDAASHLIGAAVIGLYRIRRGEPELIFSRNAPRGFLDQYRAELAHCDPMIEVVMNGRRAASGALLRGSQRWNVRIMEDLLRRWRFTGNLCGPVFVDARLAGLIYAADAGPMRSDDAARTECMDYICRSASIALTRILANGGDDDAQARDAPALTDPIRGLPPRSAQVAALLCRGLTNKEIAREMAISHHTVKEHVTKLCVRFGAQNRTNLAAAILKASRVAHTVENAGHRGRLLGPNQTAAAPTFHIESLGNDYF